MRKPRTWIIALTYQPKIPAVLAGECHQTIRPGWKRRPGDKLLIHGWTGMPYRSPWSFRVDREIYMATRMILAEEGILMVSADDGRFDEFHPWNSAMADYLAIADHIEPRTGEGLGRLFNEMYDLSEPMPFQALVFGEVI